MPLGEPGCVSTWSAGLRPRLEPALQELTQPGSPKTNTLSLDPPYKKLLGTCLKKERTLLTI
jgi:hypothetical protein